MCIYCHFIFKLFTVFLKIYLLIMLLQLSHFPPFTPLHPAHSLSPTFPPYSSRPWVIHISSWASTFPTLFLPSPCLFCTFNCVLSIARHPPRQLLPDRGGISSFASPTQEIALLGQDRNALLQKWVWLVLSSLHFCLFPTGPQEWGGC